MFGLSKTLLSSRRAGLASRGAVRNMFIQTETTPNPHSLKFTPGIEVTSFSYTAAAQREAHAH
jgi:hypothetical protein